MSTPVWSIPAYHTDEDAFLEDQKARARAHRLDVDAILAEAAS